MVQYPVRRHSYPGEHYVLQRGPGLRADTVEVAGEEEDDRTGGTPNLWPSDHAGVVASLELPRPGNVPSG